MSYQTLIFKNPDNSIVLIQAQVRTDGKVDLKREITEQVDGQKVTTTEKGLTTQQALLKLQLPNLDKPTAQTVPCTDYRYFTDHKRNMEFNQAQKLGGIILTGAQIISLLRITIDPDMVFHLLQSIEQPSCWRDIAVDLTCMNLAHQRFPKDKKYAIAERLIFHASIMRRNPGPEKGYREKTLFAALHAFARLIAQRPTENNILRFLEFTESDNSSRIRQAAYQAIAIVFNAMPPIFDKDVAKIRSHLTRQVKILISSMETRDTEYSNLVGCAYHAAALLAVPELPELTAMVKANPHLFYPNWRIKQMTDSLLLWQEDAPQATKQHAVLANSIKQLQATQ